VQPGIGVGGSRATNGRAVNPVNGEYIVSAVLVPKRRIALLIKQIDQQRVQERPGPSHLLMKRDMSHLGSTGFGHNRDSLSQRQVRTNMKQDVAEQVVCLAELGLFLS